MLVLLLWVFLSRKQKAESFFRLKAESLRLKAVGELSQKQLTRGLPFLKLKAESERLKAIRKPSQKQLTRGLPQPASHKADASGFAMTALGEGFCMLKARRLKLKALTIIIALTVVVIVGEQTDAQTKPLKIGDTIGQSTFNSLKSSLNRNRVAIELAHKPLLLIFWNPLCREAKLQLQQFNQLQKQYGEQVQLLAISKDAITGTQADDLNIPIVSGYPHLDALFPHHILPHVIWLDEQQKIKAISAGDFVDDIHVKRLLKKEPLAVPEKKDQLHFDAQQNLLQLKTGEKLGESAFYSFIGGQIAGINPQYGVKVDSLKGTIRTWVYNFDAYHLYLLSINRFLGLAPNSVVWEVKAPEKFRYQPSMGYRSLWEQQNQYSYESVWPISIPTAERLDRIRQDLNTMLGVNARWESRKVSAWVIQADGTAPTSKGGKAINSLGKPGTVKVLQNEYLKALTYELNKNPNRPPVIDETGWTAKLDFQIPGDTDFDDLAALNRALESYHIKIVAEERTVPFFILSDINPSKL